MSGATLNSPAQRIGKTLGEVLAHAEPMEVLSLGADNKSMPKKGGGTIVFTRFLPFGGATTDANTINRWVVDAASHILQEGVTPESDSLTRQDITVVMQQYGCLYMYTNVQEDLGEDDLPPEMKKQTGERMGLVREMVRYGAVKACSNVYYAGGTSRLTVDETVSLNLLALVTRGLKANHAQRITRVLAATPDFNTSPVQPGYLVFAHTDLEHDIRQIPNFIPAESYGQRKQIHPEEIGASGPYRFILSPELAGVPNSGASVGSTGLNSTSGSQVDVYQVVVAAANAYGEVALKGMNSFDFTDLKPGQKDKQDPHGQRGYVGATFYSAATTLNDGWMAIIECGITDLTP